MKRMLCAMLVLAQVGTVHASVPGQGISLLGVSQTNLAVPAATPGAPVLGPRVTPPAPALGPREARRQPEPKQDGWLGAFGKGFVHGVTHALPNLWSAFKESPVKTTLMVGAMVALGVASPPLALVAGGALLGVGVYQTGGDARKLGELAGETAFFGAAGAGAVKLAARPKGITLRDAPFLYEPKPVVEPVAAPKPAPKSADPLRIDTVADLPPIPARTAPELPAKVTSPLMKVQPGQELDLVTGLPLREGQQYHGQLFDYASRRPLASPRDGRARFDGETGRELTLQERYAAARQEQMSRSERVEFAVARARRARFDADFRHRDAAWVRELKEKGLVEWWKTDLNPHEMQAKYWGRANDDGFESVRGRSENCVFASWAGDEILAGRPIAVPRDNKAAFNAMQSGATPVEFFQHMYGKRVGSPTSKAGIEADLLAAGEGSRGIVHLDYGDSAHVLNAVVHQGKVYFLDFQSGQPGTFSGAVEVRFLKTT